MSPQEFMRRHETDWHILETLLADTAPAKKPSAEQQRETDVSLPERYRQACQQLALARERHYPPALVERLNAMVVRAHHRLYQTRAPLAALVSEFLLRGFPQLVRHHAGLFWLASLIFFGSFVAIAAAIWFNPPLVYSVLDAEQVHQYEHMYDPARRVVGFERDDASDFMMFGHYIQNNIGIGFKTFAGGVFAGVGSLFILLTNGIVIGAVAGHLTRVGYSETFWSFVIGHGAFELTAIVICGMAGFLLGSALIAPGQYTRGEALKLKAQPAVRLVYGATVFLFIAAVIEAFWSSSTLLPVEVKYGVGALLWLLVGSYLLLAGRGMDAHR
ncbi:MAG: stage II sporulation protein M [Moraxellaceae bacterium]|nr:stage II sporulation protein M [Moraxellaceae bacterium]